MFSNGKWNKNVTTVGEVIAELSLLDPELPVHSSFVDSVDLVVFNRKQDDKHLSFEDGEQWDNEDENGEEE
jgi:hypothetical protein